MPDGNVFARYGGEEFAMVLSNSGYGDVAVVAERVLRGVGMLSLRHEGSPLGIVILSVRIDHAITGDTNAQALFREADKALYKAKRASRNQVRY
jgi:diguanylate cyclase (GGDEF)-like protein